MTRLSSLLRSIHDRMRDTTEEELLQAIFGDQTFEKQWANWLELTESQDIRHDARRLLLIALEEFRTSDDPLAFIKRIRELPV